MTAIGGIPSSPPPVVDGHAGHSAAPGAAPGTPIFSVPMRSDPATGGTSHNHSTPTPSSTGMALQPGMKSGGRGSAGGLTHPNHIPLAGQAHEQDGHGLHERALGLRAYRQQLIASNIANADTPNYKAVDIEIQEALRRDRSISASANMATTNSRHLQGQASNPFPAAPLKYPVPQQDSVDGNTVELNVERSKFTQNAVMYEFSLDRISGHFKMMMEMLKNLVN